MYISGQLALLPMPVQNIIREKRKAFHDSVEMVLDNQNKIRLVASIAREFDIVRKPDGRIGYDVRLNEERGPSLSIYCCVKNFSEAQPIMDRLIEAGYDLEDGYSDDKYAMSRQFAFTKPAGQFHEWIYLTLYALKDLGSTCRAVSIGYESPPYYGPEEKFKLVCDDLEEKALQQDVNDPSYL